MCEDYKSEKCMVAGGMIALWVLNWRVHSFKLTRWQKRSVGGRSEYNERG